MNRLTCLVLVILLATAGSASGQIVFGQPAYGSPQFVYSHWTLTANTGDEVTVSQSYVPLTGYVPIQDNLEAQIYLATSSNSTEYVDLKNSLSGLSDVKIQVSRSFSNDQLLVSGGVNLPLGKTELDLVEQGGVIEFLSQDFLEFPLRSLGQGFGFNLLVGGATTLGEAKVGAGIAYQFTGEYVPYDGMGDYNPGDIVSLNAGIDVAKGSMSWAFNAAYTIYGTEQLDGLKTFKQSQQLALNASGTHRFSPHSITGWITWVGRGDNTFYDTTETVLSELKLYGNEFSAGAEAYLMFAEVWHFVPSVKLRTIAENEFTLGSADMISLGGAVGRRFTEKLNANVGFNYFTGSANDDLIDLSGYQISAGLTATL